MRCDEIQEDGTTKSETGAVWFLDEIPNKKGTPQGAMV
jgi:hypothetical protein